MHISKKRLKPLFVVVFLCTLAIIIGGVFFYFHNTNAIRQFSEELAFQMLENNPLELHYSIAHPEKMGFGNISTNLIPFKEPYYENAKTYWSSQADKLAKIQKTFLNKENAFLYSLLDTHIQLQLEGLEFSYYENPLSCTSGVHSQLPILLSEYTFRNKKDIENYFVLLSQIPDYLHGLYTYAYKQDLNGICVYKPALEEVEMQCIELFPEESLKSGTHFLQTSFVDRATSLLEQEILSKTELDGYAKRNTALLTTQIMPAYKKLAQNLSTLRGTDTLRGLAAYPKGKEYYQFLVAANTGSARTVTKIQEMLYTRYDELYASYKALVQEGNLVQNLQFPIVSHKEMVAHLYKTSQKDFPALTATSPNNSNKERSSGNGGVKQHVNLKKVHGVLADMSAPAFYMTPPIDENNTHTIYINPSAKMKHLDLYTTLAHEGFPGHLYQTVYSQNALNNSQAPLIRQLLYYGGFTEGWAVYAELYSYQFAAEICDKKLVDTLSLQRINREIQLCICSMLDIYIHYDGADLEKVKDLLTTLGLNTENAETIYEVICDAPANYLKYYVGYLEILELKEKAKELWNEEYSDYTFHKWLLESGGGDYKNLEELLR